MNNYVIFDRDGTLIELEHYLVQPERIRISNLTIRGLQRLSRKGYKFGVISNQSLIGRGIASREQVDLVNNEMLNQFNSEGINFDFMVYCPHSPIDLCACRKPKKFLGEKAISEYSINVHSSYMIGDMDSDIEFGIALQLTTIKISSLFSNLANFTAENIYEASNKILSN